MDRGSSRGITAVDVLLTVVVAALVSATTLPVVAGALSHERAWSGARYLWLRLQQAQLDAFRRGRFVALRFEVGTSDTLIQPFVDGNGDGVLARDVEQGVDVPLGPAEQLGTRARGVSLRLNQNVADIDGSGVLPSGGNPLRIGRSSFVSFSPWGSATAGTLYVAAERGPQLAIRITGATGRIRLLRFDPGASAWRP